jgi:hypothetical protein
LPDNQLRHVRITWFVGALPQRGPSLAFTLSSYFPPSEANGGWRKTTNRDNIRALGMNPDSISALGAYAMSLPWENYYTGVSGYSPRNKASLAPYALAGDDNGNYRPWTPTVGSHTLKATPYAGANATGTAGSAVTVAFTVK